MRRREACVGPVCRRRVCRGETVAVCTIEKANVAINKLAQEGRLGERGLNSAGPSTWGGRVHAGPWRVHARQRKAPFVCRQAWLPASPPCRQPLAAPVAALLSPATPQASCAAWWWMSCTWCPMGTGASGWR